jgi:nucleoside-diphosphate kinase
LLIIKPDAVARNVVGEILSRVENRGFVIQGLLMVRLTEAQARQFYAVHDGKPFLDSLVEYMSSGPCVVVSLERDDAVAELRDLVGATDPAQADPDTVRREFGLDVQKNSVHASDSDDNAGTEIRFFFGGVRDV